jgi:hypothetical protein
MQHVSRKRINKYVPVATNTHTTVEFLLKTVFYTWSVQRGYEEDNWGDTVRPPFGGGVEYLHRDPGSRRRRQKGKSQI